MHAMIVLQKENSVSDPVILWTGIGRLMLSPLCSSM